MMMNILLLLAAAPILTLARGMPQHGVRADARNQAQSVLHSRYQQKNAWLKVPAGLADSGWNAAIQRWWQRIEGDGQIYVPQWEAIVHGYGQYLAYQRQTDAYFFEELNQEMHSVLWATRTFMKRRAAEKMMEAADKKVRADVGRQARDVTKKMKDFERQNRRVRGDAVNLAAAQVHLTASNTALSQKNYHSTEADKALTSFYAELDLAREKGMTAVQWNKIVALRGKFVHERASETNQHYTFLVQYSHYVLYKYRFTW